MPKAMVWNLNCGAVFIQDKILSRVNSVKISLNSLIYIINLI
jgi:hypothetical protein